MREEAGSTGVIEPGEGSTQQGIFVNVYGYLMGGVKADPDFSQWYLVIEQEIIGTN